MVVHKFDPKAFGIVLFATFEGKNIKTASVVLDTGATYTLIPWHLAEALGYKPTISKESATITTASSSILVPIITLKSVTVLGKKANDIKAIVHNLPENSRVDGLLGLSYLRNFKVKIDFGKGILIVD